MATFIDTFPYVPSGTPPHYPRQRAHVAARLTFAHRRLRFSYTNADQLQATNRRVDVHRAAMHDAAMLEKDLVAATSRALILSILTEGDTYGYEIIQRVAALTRNELVWTDGMLYPVLHRLEDSDCVRSYWQTSPTGRKRKYYSLTDIGLTELDDRKRQWLVAHEALNALWRGT